MGILPKPHATLSDADVADGLSKAVAVIDPLLDLLSETDVTGLRARTHRLLRPARGIGDRIRRFRVRRRRKEAGRAPSNANRAMNAGAHLANAVELPGTAAWERMSRDQRVSWWVNRVGGLDTVAVASPGAFGWLNRLLPISDIAGFVNQAIVLCAVAREYGVTDHRDQVRLLAEVLCRRQLPPDFDCDDHPDPGPLPETAPKGFAPLDAIKSSMPVVVTRTLWQLAGILRAVFDETGKRHKPTKRYRYLSMIPGLGWGAVYLGERSALKRSARDGVAWLNAHTAETTHAPGPTHSPAPGGGTPAAPQVGDPTL